MQHGIESGVRDPEVQRQLQSIAANVRRHRTALSLTQEQLGEAAGITYRYLQDIEGGRKNLTIDTLVKLARALGVPPLQLMQTARLLPARVGRPRQRSRQD